MIFLNANLNDTAKPPNIFSKPVVVQYKLMIVHTKEINDAPNKEVIGVIEKQNYLIEE